LEPAPDTCDGPLGRAGKRTAPAGGRLLAAGKPAVGRGTEVVGRVLEYRSYLLLIEAAEVDAGGRDADTDGRVGREAAGTFFFEIGACEGIRDTDGPGDGRL
jgi:hypothetical protein